MIAASASAGNGNSRNGDRGTELAHDPPAASVPRRAPTTLDYTAFPHIFDLILSYTPWAGVLAFRTTSTEIRDKIDSQLGKHLVLGPIGGLQYGMSVTGTNGRAHPAFAVWSPEWNQGVEDDDDDDGMDTL